MTCSYENTVSTISSAKAMASPDHGSLRDGGSAHGWWIPDYDSIWNSMTQK